MSQFPAGRSRTETDECILLAGKYDLDFRTQSCLSRTHERYPPSQALSIQREAVVPTLPTPLQRKVPLEHPCPKGNCGKVDGRLHVVGANANHALEETLERPKDKKVDICRISRIRTST